MFVKDDFSGHLLFDNFSGAFGGDIHLKSVLQWIAASQAKRPMRCVNYIGINGCERC